MIFSELVIILLCLLGTAFFEGIETGVISINRMRLRHLAEQDDRPALILERFIEKPDRLLGTTLLGVNLCMVMASVIAARLGEDLFGSWGEAIMGVLMTLTVLVFAEYLPKAWFQSQPLKRSRLFAYVLRWCFWTLRPVSNVLNTLTSWVIPGAGQGEARRPLFSTKEEIDLLAQESADRGALSPRQRIMIRRVLDLSAKTAADIMTARALISTILESASVTELGATVKASGHTHLPVADTAGKMRGTVNFFDVMAGCEDLARGNIGPFVRPPLFIPHTAPLVEVFAKLRSSKQPMALVVGQAGDVVGLITDQDVLKQIVGTL